MQIVQQQIDSLDSLRQDCLKYHTHAESLQADHAAHELSQMVDSLRMADRAHNIADEQWRAWNHSH
jgi:hypothetical protein